MHWLRARALRDRWREEIILLGYEMTWTVNFYYHQSNIWTERRRYAEGIGCPGTVAYASRMIARYRHLALDAEGRFKIANPEYKSNITSPTE